MSRTATCPGDAVLELLLDGSLPETDGQALRGHLESCGACQERIESLAYDRWGNPRSIPCPAPAVIRRYLDGSLEDHASEVIGHHADACRPCAAVLDALTNGEPVPGPAACPPEADLRRLVAGTLPEGRQAALAGHLDGCEGCRARLDALAGGDELPGRMEALRRPAVADAPGLERIIGALKDSYQTGPGAATGTFAASGVVPPTELLGLLDPPGEAGDLGKVGPYRVLEVLGSGGMGIVLRGFDPALNRPVAIKVLAPQLATSGTARQRFAREARAAAAIRNEHVVAIHSVDEWRGLPYLVMEFIPGRSLQARIEDAPLDLTSILRIGMQAAAGLAAAHAQGLVHRDIKPSNILLENCVERVKITDFGLARAADDASLTHSGFVAGTPLFMAPEQARGDAIDHRADLFSLGVVLYSMCTGRSPFRASTTLAVLKRVCDDAHRPIRETNPDIPESLCRIIDRLLAKEPGDRYSSAEDVARVLADRLAARQRGEPDEPEPVANEPIPSVIRSSFAASPVLDDVGPEKPPTAWAQWPRRLLIAGAIVFSLVFLLLALRMLTGPQQGSSVTVVTPAPVKKQGQVIVRAANRSYQIRLRGTILEPLPRTATYRFPQDSGWFELEVDRDSMMLDRKTFYLDEKATLEIEVSPEGKLRALTNDEHDTLNEDRVRRIFRGDPEVVGLANRIEPIENKRRLLEEVLGNGDDPAVRAVKLQLEKLKKRYEDLWEVKSRQIRRRLLTPAGR
ncbi:Serine/threonine-protein kinase PrkC [Aquisphaera giovannonii]|uniref:Serine/threonine-protein kinase PrkC n=1 Tax=Aquisphaera giovannonii TaxID=406548 RepID=A0A5B9W1S7_9BACT|nr:protein kinase [Aquisphaera giovannonii]QEH34478.1 Serine/threonine-protein kinase PrkC [Aquisphaera giovannonii]